MKMTRHIRTIRHPEVIDRRNFLKLAGIVGATAAGFSVPGVLGRGIAYADAAPFKIGFVRVLTGLLASTMNPLYPAISIAVDEINASGGILGRQIVLQEEDDEGSPANQPAVISKFSDAGINVVIGPAGSSQTLASLASSSAAQMIQSAFAFSDEVGDPSRYPYHYQLVFTTSQLGQVAVDHFVNRLGIKKIGILRENTAFGEAVTKASVANLDKAGLQPTTIQNFSLGSPDLTPYITNLRNSGAEAILAWFGNSRDLGLSFNAMASANWSPPVVGYNIIFQEKVLELVPAAALQNVFGVHYKSLTFTDKDNPGQKQQNFAEKLKAYPQTKGLEAYLAGTPWYDFLHLLKVAVEQEKSFDTAAIQHGLNSIRNYPGLLGSISFSDTDHKGISIDDVALATVASGKDPRANGCFRQRLIV
jgi:ABC-type branched-subunit amino acid transport system substrate-binding protein